MFEKNNEHNQAEMAGEVISGFQYNNSVMGEAFYMVMLRVKRLSDVNDTIPLIISERMIDVSESLEGRYIHVTGQFRSYNQYVNKRSRLILSVFVKSIKLLDGEEHNMPNSIFLEGYICREPVFRNTYHGRSITDVMVAVPRDYGRSDYIPCIVWGRNAAYVARQPVGTCLKLWGRAQSRVFRQKIAEGEYVSRNAYEISVNHLERVSQPEAEPARVAEDQ